MSLISRYSVNRIAKAIAPVVESLETRFCLSATLNDGTLAVYGTRHSSHVTVSLDAHNSSLIDVNVNGGVQQFDAADVTHILVTALRGNSTAEISDANGQVNAPVTMYGGGGNDTLIGGGAGDMLVATAGNNLLVEQSGHNTLIGGSGHDTLVGTANDTMVKGSPATVTDHWNSGDISAGFTPFSIADAVNSTEVVGYTPQQIDTAYSMPTLAAAAPGKQGQVIAVIDAFDDPTAASDLATFSTQFGLAAPNFQLVYATGNNPGIVDPFWAGEASLDIEWAHAMAPQAKIILVEANSDSTDDLEQAQQVAGAMVQQAGGGVVTMSFGGAENADDDAAEDAIFSNPAYSKVSWVAAAGDTAGIVSIPAISPFVTSVGGTTLELDDNGHRTAAESAWADGGGGVSTVETVPTYQLGLTVDGAPIGGFRVGPDVSMDADPATGVAVFDSTPDVDGNTGWAQVGGTSAAAPMFAGIVADANAMRASMGLSVLGGKLNTQLYQLAKVNYASLFTDITTGDNTVNDATVGFDLATGFGSPKGDALIDGLAGVVPKPPESMVATYNYSLANPLPLGQSGVDAFAGGGTVTVNAAGNRVDLTLGVTKITNSTLNLTFGKLVLTNGVFRGHGVAIVTDINGLQTNFDIRVGGTITRKHHQWIAKGSFFAVFPAGTPEDVGTVDAPIPEGKYATFSGTFTY